MKKDMKETIETLQDPETMRQILESGKNVKKGKIEEFIKKYQFR